mgnify:CR=1 FL=1
MKKLLVLLLCFFPAFASAAPKTPDVKLALAEWVAAVESKDVKKIVSLYDKDSVMLSAFAVDPITSHKGLAGYYTKVVAEPEISIKVVKQDARVFGDVAVNTGLYNFYWVQDGEPMDIPARFSFVYVLKDGKWSIISHHSSRVPGK